MNPQKLRQKPKFSENLISLMGNGSEGRCSAPELRPLLPAVFRQKIIDFEPFFKLLTTIEFSDPRPLPPSCFRVRYQYKAKTSTCQYLQAIFKLSSEHAQR